MGPQSHLTVVVFIRRKETQIDTWGRASWRGKGRVWNDVSRIQGVSVVASTHQKLAERPGNCPVPALPAATWPVPPGTHQCHREVLILLLFGLLLCSPLSVQPLVLVSRFIPMGAGPGGIL